MSTLAERIKEAMGGMSAADLARATKSTPGAVTQWLDGTTKSLRAEKAVLMERATGYRAAWITTGQTPKKIAQEGSELETAFADIVAKYGIDIERADELPSEKIPLHIRRHAGFNFTPDFLLTWGDHKMFVEVKGHADNPHAQLLLNLEQSFPDDFALFVADFNKPGMGVEDFLRRIDAIPSMAAHFGRTRRIERSFARRPAAVEPAVEPGVGSAVAVELPKAYGMEPILAWDYAEDLPDGEFVMVPRLDVHLSAGGGRDQVEIELTKDNPQAFRAEWIRLMKLKPAKLACMRASGESMEPTIHDGDSLLIDTSQTEVRDGGVYALWYDGGERVKRLFRLPGGALRIESDNQRFRALEVRPEDLEHVRVIGKVVHRSGTGGL